MIETIKLGELSPDVVSLWGVVRIALGEKLSPEGLLEVASKLGKPEGFVLPKYRPAGFPPEVTLIDTHGDGVSAAPRGFGQGWHQDSTYLADPPQFTVLHSLEVPSSGGDTMFADTRPALRALSEDDREALKNTSLEHSVRDSYRISAKDAGRSLDELRRSLPSASHPAVFSHPRGGTSLWLSPLYTQGGLDERSRPLFERAMKEVVKTRTNYSWRAGEILVWDNRVVLHAASSYAGDQRRLMMRTMARDTGVGGK